MESVEFLSVEVTKEFMSLTVGDILRVNPKTGNYELHVESEDIGDSNYSHEKYEISLQPWIIEKYSDHFQIYEELNPKDHFNGLEEKFGVEEELGDDTRSPCGSDVGIDGYPAEKNDIDTLRKELVELKEMFAKVQEMLKE